MKKNNKKESLINKRMKSTLRTGVGTMAGNLALGSIAGLPGMPAAGVASMGTMSAGLNLLNVAELGKTAMALPDMMSKDSRHRNKRKKCK
jgi:hypothetical protein